MHDNPISQSQKRGQTGIADHRAPSIRVNIQGMKFVTPSNEYRFTFSATDFSE